MNTVCIKEIINKTDVSGIDLKNLTQQIMDQEKCPLLKTKMQQLIKEVLIISKLIVSTPANSMMDWQDLLKLDEQEKQIKIKLLYTFLSTKNMKIIPSDVIQNRIKIYLSV